ncbi:beta-1,4-N-acetylgalactosaminyltransferase bre-4-like isoform X2 [Haliotis rufescens]|uniref:beta-1,4-N-acetylgalactosaminyltransferase bre-4-like isoform X2 n=1 Tax=Haliotis rufescens TaxID=6454 RepID=UPI00201EDCB8|nr:beta-1,4-N-acetylgalactosaminyltransferase bre-4-like isoform X2 [Haliotis rufescens]
MWTFLVCLWKMTVLKMIQVGKVGPVKTRYLLLVSLLVIVILLNGGVSMVLLKLRHPGQIPVKIMTAPLFVPEDPDFKQRVGDIRSPGLCPKTSPLLVGETQVDESPTDLLHLSRTFINSFRPGGHYKPPECVSRTKTAVIVAYRNRQRHLVVLLNHLIPFLVRQQADFAIFVVEPLPNVTFNRALLMNIGFVEALKTYNFTCFIFHDVDLLPVTDHNLYRCGATPRHMAVSNSKLDNGGGFHAYAGGVMAMSRDIYMDINGHSNLYFGWGGEDDDLLSRLAYRNYMISRYPSNIGRYKAVYHTEDRGNSVSNTRYQLLWTAEERLKAEGLSSLKYRKVKHEARQFYTWIFVDINKNEYSQAIADFT